MIYRSAQEAWNVKHNQEARRRGEVAVIMRNRGATYREIGDYLGVTVSRAVQIEQAGLRRRHTWASAGQCRCLYGQEVFSSNYPARAARRTLTHNETGMNWHN